jgi:flagellar operon protein
MSGGPFLYPNVTSLPGQSGVGQTDRQSRKQEGAPGEFGKALDSALGKQSPALTTDLSQVKAPLKISAHASQRLQDRKIKLDAETMSKVNDAVDKAAAKGLEDTLVLTKDAAFIVSVKNRTVITALDRNSLSGNVFTNIDGAVIV